MTGFAGFVRRTPEVSFEGVRQQALMLEEERYNDAWPQVKCHAMGESTTPRSNSQEPMDWKQEFRKELLQEI